jgi:hypothetical protein
MRRADAIGAPPPVNARRSIMVRNAALVARDRFVCLILGVIAGVFATTAFTATQPPPPAPAQQAQAGAPTRVFASDAGLVLNFVKADKTKDFEAVITRLKDALAESAKPARKEQAKGWRVYKSSDPAAGGAALYVFIVDPPVKGADYTVTGILGEMMSGEDLAAATKQYVDSYATGQNWVNLALVADFSK